MLNIRIVVEEPPGEHPQIKNLLCAVCRTIFFHFHVLKIHIGDETEYQILNKAVLL